jgi:hypothetical protein
MKIGFIYDCRPLVGSGGRVYIGHYFKLVVQWMSLNVFGQEMAIWIFIRYHGFLGLSLMKYGICADSRMLIFQWKNNALGLFDLVFD